MPALYARRTSEGQSQVQELQCNCTQQCRTCVLLSEALIIPLTAHTPASPRTTTIQKHALPCKLDATGVELGRSSLRFVSNRSHFARSPRQSHSTMDTLVLKLPVPVG